MGKRSRLGEREEECDLFLRGVKCLDVDDDDISLQ